MCAYLKKLNIPGFEPAVLFLTLGPGLFLMLTKAGEHLPSDIQVVDGGER